MRKSKARGNTQGCAYKRGKTWVAQVVIGWRIPKDPSRKPIPVKRRKGGFPTKAAALAACPELRKDRSVRPDLTLQQVYNEWADKYASRIGASTMAGYKSAYSHFSLLQYIPIRNITAQDLQDTMDACTAGKRTHQVMKVTAGLIWAYACDAEYVDRNITENLYTGKGKSVQREPLTEQEVETIRKSIGKEPYAEYVYAMCYLGFRPGEFLKLKKTDFHKENGISYLIGGSKTDAGRDRRVPVPSTIREIITNRLNVIGTDYLFPRTATNRKGEFIGYKEMSDAYFRESIFKPLMEKLGIAAGKVPYCARHTYSDKLKNASGDDKAKAEIFGHTDYNFTRKRYQSTDLKDIKKVADSIK